MTITLNKKFKCVRILSLSTFLFICNLASAEAASTLSVKQSGATNFIAQASNLEKVAAISLTIGYDASSLSAPVVVQGNAASGAMMSSNINVPGIIRVAVVSSAAFKGSGTVLQITFGTRNGTGGITSVSCEMLDVKGGSIPCQAGFQNTLQSQESSSTGQDQNNSATSGQYVYQGTISIPDNTLAAINSQGESSIKQDPPVSDAKQASEATPASPEKFVGKPAAVTPATDTVSRNITVYQGILDRFAAYKGGQTLAALSALFKNEISATIVQEPAVALSDGKSPVQMNVVLKQASGNSPNFAASSAKILSLKAGNDAGCWVIELLPNANALKSTLTMLSDTAILEYPLTVAPPVAASVKLDEAGFQKFLKETGTLQAPLHDLNQDGRRDYQDVYIFVANYLKSASAGNSGTTPKTEATSKKDKNSRTMKGSQK